MTRDAPFPVSTAWLMARALFPMDPRDDGTVEVLAADPSDTLALDVLAAVLDRPVIVRESDRDTIRRKLLHRAESQGERLADITSGAPDAIDSQIVDRELLGNDPDDPRIIRLVNTVLTDAVKYRASDVHLEPEPSGLRIRYRIDGLLEDIDILPSTTAEPVISRIKVMAAMDVSQRRQPQDGSVSVTYAGHPMDIRVSTVPTPGGERVALRLLQRGGTVNGLDALGVPPRIRDTIDSILEQTQGLFLVAGPTGSGKTTTLYACLERIDTKARNTITIEDPVEYDIPGISQIQVGRSRSFGFADGLRSLLRQDPDVLMVGEIRDGETAGIAFQSALTGHLILSTIHTVDPAAAVIRLLDLGVEPALIAETLGAVMDQRLVRTVCTTCRGRTGNRSCPSCRGTGFSGRTGVYRLLKCSPMFQRAIRENNPQKIRDIVDTVCGNDLMQQARDLVQNGHTTDTEIHRVLGKHGMPLETGRPEGANP